MTSLIFGTALIAHKAIIGHKREKDRIKNYERWEGLRDEYDEQRKISRESRSLDIQRTGAWDGSTTGPSPPGLYEDRPILTLRDQQEANDARTSWRPQEHFDGPHTQQLHAQLTGQVQQSYPYQNPGQRHVSTPAEIPQPTQSQSFLSPTPPAPQRSPLHTQKTGSTWDEGIPEPLHVSRRSFDDYNYGRYRSPSSQRNPSPNTVSRVASTSDAGSDASSQGGWERPGMPHAPSGLRSSISVDPQPTGGFDAMVQSMATGKHVVPVSTDLGIVESHVPGGRMAELIERGY